MATLLRIDSSANPESSASRELTEAFTRAWQEAGGEVVARDLHAQPLPHLPHSGLHYAERVGVAEDAPERALQDEVIAQVSAADAIVIGAPMYNYSMPSTLKAWLDYLHVPGLTSPREGQEALLKGKPVVVVSTRGVAYDEGTLEADRDHVVPVFRVLLGEGMQMNVEAITLDRTLASQLPQLDAEKAAALRAGALEQAATRGRELAQQFSA